MAEENPDKKDSNITKAFQAPLAREKTEVEGGEPTIPLAILKKYEKYFKGPLPPPEVLAAYEKLVSGCAKEIIDAFIEQSKHRRELEKIVVNGDSKRADLGVKYGFVISLILIALSFVLVITGHAIAGTILGGIDLVSLVGVFIYGTSSRRKEREAKNMMSKKSQD